MFFWTLSIIKSTSPEQDAPITKDSSSQANNTRRIVDSKQTHAKNTIVEKNRSARWKLTGVVALSECQLEVPRGLKLTYQCYIYA